MPEWWLMLAGFLLLLAAIPVTNKTVISKCEGCHAVDDHGVMQRLSFERSSPEGWQQILKRMLHEYKIVITPQEAHEVIRYLSDSHGLAPGESKPVMYEPERRIHDEHGGVPDSLVDTCAKCHSLARALTWRRSADDWKEFGEAHATRYKMKLTPDVLSLLARVAPLETAEWSAWSARKSSPELTGRWLVTAHILGKGIFYGDMEVMDGAGVGEFATHLKLRSISDGSTVEREGTAAIYAGHEWRGRSHGIRRAGSFVDDLSSEAREAMWISPDGAQAEGRCFWGQYQEFGFDVTMRRISGVALQALDVVSLKIGSQRNRIRFEGESFPERITALDITAGPGVVVRRIVSNSATQVEAEVDVDSSAVPGKRDVWLSSSRLPAALTLYDRIDYVKVVPDSAMAAFANDNYSRGYQQFEAIAYQRGPDGRIHTSDDLELGPIQANWSMEVFYETDTSMHDVVGSISQNGFFTPAARDPGMNYDVWIIATVKSLTGKSYLVVTVPTYTFKGRAYVRDLDRWIEEQE